jgi:cold shock CspA family protein
MTQKAIVTFVKNDYGFAKTEDSELSILFHFSNERDVKFLEDGQPFLSIFKKRRSFSKVGKGTRILVDIVNGSKGLKAESWGVAPIEKETKPIALEQGEEKPLYRILKYTRFVGSKEECMPEVVWEGNDVSEYPRDYRIDYFSCGDFDSWISTEQFVNGEWQKI